MMNWERWERLAGTLAERGGVVPAPRVDARNYPGGTSYSITLQTADGGAVIIRDTVWRKNHDIWTGYQVDVSDGEGICTRMYPKTKARGPVADQVREAVTAAGGLRKREAK